MGKYRIETEDGKSYEIETEDNTPNPVSAPKRDRMSEMIGNIPGSLKRTLTHPTFPGMPVGGANIQPGEDVGYTKEKFMSQDWPKIKNFAQHPIESIKDYVTSNPVESALGVAAIGRGAAPQTAAKVENYIGPRVSAVAKGVKAGVPDILSGGAMIGAGELMGQLPGMQWPARIAFDYPGARAVAHGMHKGFNTTKTEWGNIGKVNPLEAKTNTPKSPDIAPEMPVKPLGQPVPETPTSAVTTLPVQPVNTPGTQVPRPGTVAPITPPDIAKKPIIPELKETVKGTPDMPLATEVIKPNTQPPGEKLIPDEVKTDPMTEIRNKELIAAEIRAQNAKAKYDDIINYMRKEGVTKKQFAEMTPEERSARVKDMLHEETTYFPAEHPTKSGNIQTIKGQRKYPRGFTESNLKNFLNLWLEEK
jgi:hypothetical protein